MIERLTVDGYDYCGDYCTYSDDCAYYAGKCPTPCADKAIYDRLMEYENTGKSPEEISGAEL